VTRDDGGRVPGADRWLERWLALLEERARGAPLLELGCGSGEDSATLAARGLDLVALDRSGSALAGARARVPAARFLCRDLRDPLPVDDASVGAVVASLSLHYFPWDETVAIVSRVRRALRPRGILVARLNSTRDHHYGASGHPAIEPDYYDVDSEPKRFFDEAGVRRLFAGRWSFLALEERVSTRFGKPKVLWEVVVEAA